MSANILRSKAVRIILISVSGFAAIVAVLIFSLDWAYDRYGISREVVATSVSPNHKVEAVLTETNGGATTDFGYLVDIKEVPSGSQVRVADLYGTGRNEQAYGANLVWLNDHTLDIQYMKTKDARLAVPEAILSGQHIAIRLHSGVRDDTAPAGGMECNLPGHSCR